ncbi:hypothetical protein HDE_02483 [Halotydeus destructor]|nr:hypothetical protein HDE_02483 [Halotydeus destructor]
MQGEPVELTSPLLAADVTIISKTKASFIIRTGVMDALNNFTLETYLWYVIALSFVFLVMMAGQRLGNPRSTVRYMQDVLLHMYSTAVDQENLSNKQCPSRSVIWLTLNCAQFVVVFGYLCNFMSTDKIATVIPPQIDSLNDLLSDRFSDVQPMILQDVFLFEYLKRSPKTSALGKLFTKMEADKMASYIKMGDDEQSQRKVLGKISYLMNGTRSVSLTKELATFGVSGLCMLDTNVASLFRMSEHDYAQGLLTTFMNHQAHPVVKNFVRHRTMSVFELGIFPGFVANWRLQIFEIEFDGKTNMEALQCEQNVKGRGVRKLFIFHEMALGSLDQLFLAVMVSGILCCATVAVEVAHAQTQRKRKKLAEDWSKVNFRIVRTSKLFEPSGVRETNC